MVKKIFRAIFLTSLVIFLATLLSCLYVFRTSLRSQYQEQLKLRMILAELAMKENKDAFFAIYNNDENADRITWLDRNGKVLFDSQADTDNLENHDEREEVKAASLWGEGQSYRLSKTMRNLTLYYAKKLDDGTILRLSTPGLSLWQLFIWLSTPLFFILLTICFISLFCARRLAGRIVKPLTHLNLDSPLKNESYNELSPILHHIDKQRQLLAAKANELNSKDKELAALTHYMSEGMIVLDIDGVIKNINREAACYLGVDPAGVCGNRLYDICRQSHWRELLLQVKNTGNAYLEWRHENKIYSVQAYLLHEYFNENEVVTNDTTVNSGAEESAFGTDFSTVSATPDMSVDAGACKIIILLFDVTESLLASQQRKQFTANISHELKTPLHSILGSTELLAQGFVPLAEQEQFITMINKEASRLLQLVEDSLKLSQLDEKVRLPFETLDLYLLAQDVMEELQPFAAGKGVSLHLKGESLTVYGVKRLLKDVLFNLLDNSIKYNKSGGKVLLKIEESSVAISDSILEPKIKIKDASMQKLETALSDLPKANLKVCLSVEDTGIGIPEDQQRRVFERFYRVQQVDDKITGTGLGLSIVKHAVEYMQGELQLHSVLGKGTTVYVYLPSAQQ